MKTPWCLSILLVALISTACQREPSPPVRVDQRVDGHHLTVIGHGSCVGRDGHHGMTRRWFRGMEISFLSDKLVVNDKVYGTLGEGDTVTVSNNVVSINGVVASPRPMTKEEELEKYPILTEHLTIAGYPVVVTRQHRSGIVRRDLSKTERLEADGTKIAVTPKELIINGSKHVPLRDTDIIEINLGSVSVSGKKVWTKN